MSPLVSTSTRVAAVPGTRYVSTSCEHDGSNRTCSGFPGIGVVGPCSPYKGRPSCRNPNFYDTKSKRLLLS